jgi:transitional endoplasmic reticulum ATPase
MNIFAKISEPATLARVKTIENDGYRLCLELRNGQIATADGLNKFDLEIGSVILINLNQSNSPIEKVSNDLWIEESWIGIVRLKLEDITIVASSTGQWKKIKTRNDIEYSVGNTVEINDSLGIVRKLSKEPLKIVDFSTVDEIVLDKFKIKRNALKENFEDFGGLKNVVERAKELIELSLEKKKELAEIGTRQIKGILFTGSPGTGKTMLARIIANITNATFYEISGPEIFSKWYGQSEEILRMLFEDAAHQDQAIIFFDEIDSVAGQRNDETHEESRRVVAQLLALMDGFTSDSNIVVIAATNRPQDIDAALRRPGRFDWEIDFPLPNCDDRESILITSARNLATTGILPYKWIAEKTEGWSSAEITAIWSEAALLAVADDRSVIICEDCIGGFERVTEYRNLLKQNSLIGGKK